MLNMTIMSRRYIGKRDSAVGRSRRVAGKKMEHETPGGTGRWMSSTNWIASDTNCTFQITWNAALRHDSLFQMSQAT